LVLTIEWSY